jgi:hypothetical protein
LAKDLSARFPLDTQMQSLWLPIINAQLALNKKDAQAAVNLLEPGKPLELALIPFTVNPSCLYAPYLRGKAYLALAEGAKAAAEFQKILDHNGLVWNCSTGALARLGLARAYALQAGITSVHVGTAASAVPAEQSSAAGAESLKKARADYQDFFTLWKDADPGIPILRQAKEEYARLAQ